MLLLDNDDELPPCPDDEESLLASRLGSEGLLAIDSVLFKHVRNHWLKVAWVVHNAITDGGLPGTESCVRLHVRRLIELVETGVLDGRGDLRRPRWSEVRLPDGV